MDFPLQETLPLSHESDVTAVLVSYWSVKLSVKWRRLASWAEWQRRASAVYIPDKMGNISSWRTVATAFCETWRQTIKGWF